MTIKVSVWTDEPILAAGLAAVLEANGGFTLSVLTCSPEQIVNSINEQESQILLVDVNERIPLSLVGDLQRQFPRHKILLWMRNTSVQIARQVIDAGVRGIVRKSLPPELLVRCLSSVAQGENWYERGLLQSLLEARTVRLSRREIQLLNLVVQGLSNKEISSVLQLSEGTIKYYFSRLFRKIGVNDRFELAFYGLKHMMGGTVHGGVLPTVATNSKPGTFVVENPSGRLV